VRSCAVSPDGTWIVSASADNTLKMWDAASGTERTPIAGDTAVCYAISPDGAWIVCDSGDSGPRILDAATGAERVTFTGHTGWVNDCAVSPDGTLVVSASNDRTLRIWDVATGTERAVLILPGEASVVAFHPSAPMVVCGDKGGGVHLARLVGIQLGPLLVTAAIRGHELAVRCPACRETFPVQRDRLGAETTCPRPVCGTRLRINTSLLQPLPPLAPTPLPPPSRQSQHERKHSWFRRR